MHSEKSLEELKSKSEGFLEIPDRPELQSYIKTEESLRFRISQLEENLRKEQAKVSNLKLEISGKSEYFSKQVQRLQIQLDEKSTK